ncbi:MAG: Gldg family protein [Candidatus Cloacimonetes bacterium]|nr:Gldg family protein [Candidatus Cloacimonadota bacterium]
MKKTNKQASVSNLLIFIAVVIVLNLISLNVFFRLDFSKGRLYTLSPASKAALRQLEDRVVVRAYFSQDLPPDLANTRRYTRDLLEEYRVNSGGRFRYEFINPNDDRLRMEAQQSGVPPVNVNVRERDRVEVRQAYLGLVFHYGDRTEAIPLVQETRGLEYEITKAITRIASLGIPRVAFFSLEPEVQADPRMMFFFQQQDRFQHARESIRQNYDLVNTNLSEPIPMDITTLIFTGAVDSLDMYQLYNIDQFLMRGNNILFFQDKVNANLQNQSAQMIQSNIFDLLSHYGANIRENLVMDMESGQVNVQERRGIFSVNTPVQYPFVVISNTVNRHHAVVSQLANIQFLFVSEIDSGYVPEGVRFTPLIHSSNNSGTVSGPFFNINIQQFMDRNSYINRLTEQGKVLAAQYEGSFSSYFLEEGMRFTNDFIEYTDNGRIIVVADMDFISSQGAGQNPSNISFLANALDYLSDNPGLIALRSREFINKPLVIDKLVNTEDLTPEGAERRRTNMREFIKYLNIILPALLIVLYGLIRYKAELNRRKRIQDEYER